MRINAIILLAVVSIAIACVAKCTFAEAPDTTSLLESTIMVEEGFRALPYNDVRQKSVGYGLSTEWARAHGWKGFVMTRSGAKRFLVMRLMEDRITINNRIEGFDTLPAGCIAAVHSAFYNAPSLVGPNLSRYLSNRDFKAGANELAYGHVNDNMPAIKRRVREANMILMSVNMHTLTTPTSVEEFHTLQKWWANK